MIWARQAGSFWLKIGTPHAEPVTGLVLATGLGERSDGLGDGSERMALGTITTRPSGVQQREAEWPFVKLSGTRSASLTATTGLTDVSAIHSSNWSGEPAPWFNWTNASLRWSGDQAGLTTQSPLGTDASSVGALGSETST